MIHFEIPKNQSSIIKVIGVGGGGSNAVNYMHSLGIEGVDFVVCNTDSQALTLSPIHNKIQLGPHLTQGLGAGANPEIGKQASEESMEDISKILEVNTRMAFITAGMGGGTGTGGAPVVAKICKDLDILTVGIVTTPFSYEGRKRMKQAQDGIDRMRDNVDTILIISNDKLRQQYGNLPFTKAFAQADNVLATAAKCITDVINTTGQINVDFADVCTVMKKGGVAILGSATAEGDQRAERAVEEALSSPLLNDNDITGAKWILLNITSAAGEYEHTMDEAEAIQAYVQQQAGEDCDVILGMGHDPNLEGNIAVTVIATGFNHHEIASELPAKNKEPEKIIVKLGEPESAPSAISSTAETKPVASIPEPTKADAMAPRLVVDTPPPVDNRVVIDAKPHFSADAKPKETMQLKTEDEVKAESTPKAEAKNDEPEADNSLKLVIKNEQPEQEIAKPETTQTVAEKPTPGTGRELTAAEIEEKRVFEQQKRALEERAERLRRMSFDVKANDSADDLENVPAYVRKNIKIDDTVASSDTFYSGYSVGVNDKDGDNKKADIQSINTFLQGKKPD